MLLTSWTALKWVGLLSYRTRGCCHDNSVLLGPLVSPTPSPPASGISSVIVIVANRNYFNECLTGKWICLWAWTLNTERDTWSHSQCSLTLFEDFKLSGCYMYHQLWQSRIPPSAQSLYLYVCISEQTAIISLYSINWLVFITETECVYCAVRSAHTVYLCVLCGSENKQRLFHYIALTDWFL
jgi:hypothetical protein